MVMAQMCQDHSFTLPHILTWKTCSGKLWDVMTGATQHHSKRQLAQAPVHQWSPVTFKRGKSQLLLFFPPPQTGKVDVKCSATHIRASFLKSLFTHGTESHAIARHQLNCNFLKWALNFLNDFVLSAAYKMALLRNTVIEIIVIECVTVLESPWHTYRNNRLDSL